MIETIDLSIIAVYFIGSLGVGYWASRRIKSADDFAVAGGHLKFPVLLGTLIATAIGASATMGRAGKAYEVGIAIFLAGIAYAVGLYLFSYLAPVLKRMGIWSVPRALHLRYGRAFRVVAAVIIIVSLIGIYGAQLIAFGVVVVSLLPAAGVSYEQAVVVAAVIMVVYTTLGGLLAVAYTDLVQAIIMIIAVGIILPILVVIDMGGPQVAITSLAPPANWLGGMSIVYLVSIFLIDIPVSLLDVSLWQRTGASKSVKHIQTGVRITAMMFVVWSFIVVALGIFASQLLPGLENTAAGSDAAVPMLVVEYMPPIIKGLCLAALLAIIMSTADTVLLIAGTTMSWDIVSQFRSNSDGQSQISVARWTVVIAGAIGALFAIYVRDVFEVLLLAFAIYVSALFVPTMLAIFWKRATAAGAMASSIAAFLSVTYLYIQKFAGNLTELIEPVIASLAISLVTMIGVSLWTYREESATERLIDRQPARN